MISRQRATAEGRGWLGREVHMNPIICAADPFGVWSGRIDVEVPRARPLGLSASGLSCRPVTRR